MDELEDLHHHVIQKHFATFQDYTLNEWVSAAIKDGNLPIRAAEDLLGSDAIKIERLLRMHRQIGLPIDDYVILNGTQFYHGAPVLVNYFALHQNSLFSIRAIPIQSTLKHSRIHGITKEECFEFVHNLPNGRDAYRLYLSDYFIPEFSGITIITKKGLYAEMIRGRHMLLTQQALGASDIITGKLMFPYYRMVYSSSDTTERVVLWRAIKYLILETTNGLISPLSLPVFLKGYFEFVFHSAKGYRFIDFNDNPLLAQLPVPEFWPEILP